MFFSGKYKNFFLQNSFFGLSIREFFDKNKNGFVRKIDLFESVQGSFYFVKKLVLTGKYNGFYSFENLIIFG